MGEEDEIEDSNEMSDGAEGAKSSDNGSEQDDGNQRDLENEDISGDNKRDDGQQEDDDNDDEEQEQDDDDNAENQGEDDELEDESEIGDQSDDDDDNDNDGQDSEGDQDQGGSDEEQGDSSSSSHQPVEQAVRTMSFRQNRGKNMQKLIKMEESQNTEKQEIDDFWKENKYFGQIEDNLDEGENLDDQYEATSDGRDHFDSDFQDTSDLESGDDDDDDEQGGDGNNGKQRGKKFIEKDNGQKKQAYVDIHSKRGNKKNNFRRKTKKSKKARDASDQESDSSSSSQKSSRSESLSDYEKNLQQKQPQPQTSKKVNLLEQIKEVKNLIGQGRGRSQKQAESPQKIQPLGEEDQEQQKIFLEDEQQSDEEEDNEDDQQADEVNEDGSNQDKTHQTPNESHKKNQKKKKLNENLRKQLGISGEKAVEVASSRKRTRYQQTQVPSMSADQKKQQKQLKNAKNQKKQGEENWEDMVKKSKYIHEVFNQQQLLEEAVYTEIYNKKSLQDLIRLQQEKKVIGIFKRFVVTGPKINFQDSLKSGRRQVTISFSDQEVFTNTIGKLLERNSDDITKQQINQIEEQIKQRQNREDQIRREIQEETDRKVNKSIGENGEYQAMSIVAPVLATENSGAGSKIDIESPLKINALNMNQNQFKYKDPQTGCAFNTIEEFKKLRAEYMQGQQRKLQYNIKILNDLKQKQKELIENMKELKAPKKQAASDQSNNANIQVSSLQQVVSPSKSKQSNYSREEY